MFVAVGSPRGLQVMGLTEDPAVLDRGRTALSPRHHVIHFQSHRGAARSARGQRPRALPPVALHHLPLHLRRDRGAPLLLLFEQEVQRCLDDLLVRRAGLHVRLPGPGLPELGEESPGHRQVDPALRGGERLDEGAGLFGDGRLKFTRVSGSYTSCGSDPPVIKGLDGATASS